MFTEEQIKLADLFIKHISTIDYEKDEDYIEYFEREHKITNSQITLVRKLLLDNDILTRLYKSDHTVKLSIKGQKAFTIGIKEYFKEIENAETIDSTLKTATIDNYKSTKKLSRWAIICSFLVPILIAVFDKYVYNPERESNYKRSDRQEIVDSVVSQLLTDSVFIEKTKDFIKHDTIFLNELKKK